MKTVIVIEDSEVMQYNIREFLRLENVATIQIRTFEEAQTFLEQNHDLNNYDLIVMDACLQKNQGQPDTLELTKQIRIQGYVGNLLAASGEDEYNEQLLLVGANLAVPKDHVVKKIFECLGIKH